MLKRFTSTAVLLAMLLTILCTGSFVGSAEEAAVESAATFSVFERDADTEAWQAVATDADTLERAVNAVTKRFGRIEINHDYIMSGRVDNTSGAPAMLAAGKTISIAGNGHTAYVDQFAYPVNFAKGTFLVDGFHIKTLTGGKSPDGMVRVYPDAEVTVTNAVWEVAEGTASKWGTVCVYGLLTLGENTVVRNSGNQVSGGGAPVAVRVQNRDTETIQGIKAESPRGRVVTLMSNTSLSSTGSVFAFTTADAGRIVLKGLDGIAVSPTVSIPAEVDASLKDAVAALDDAALESLQTEMAKNFSNLDWSKVVGSEEGPEVWKVGDTAFSTLAEAAAAVEEGGTVYLTADHAVSAAEAVDTGRLTIDGGGHTLTGTGADAVLSVGADADLTVVNLTIESKEGTSPVATVLLNGGLTLGAGARILNYGTGVGGNSNRNAVRVASDGAELYVLTGAEINVVGTAFVSDGFTSTVTVDGGTVSTAYRFYVSNGAEKTPVLRIRSGIVLSTSTSEPFVHMWDSDLTFDISGGTVYYGANSIFVCDRDGVVANGANITGGTVKKSGKTLICLPELRKNDVRLRLPEAATAANSGIAFGTRLDKAAYDEMSSTLTTIVTGTLIVPSEYLEGLPAFTIEALTAAYGAEGFLNIVNDGWYNADTAGEDGFYCYYGSMVQVKEANYSREFAGIGYVTVTVEGIGTYTFYGEAQTGTLAALAEGASGNEAQNTMLALFRGEN